MTQKIPVNNAPVKKCSFVYFTKLFIWVGTWSKPLLVFPWPHQSSRQIMWFKSFTSTSKSGIGFPFGHPYTRKEWARRPYLQPQKPFEELHKSSDRQWRGLRFATESRWSHKDQHETDLDDMLLGMCLVSCLSAGEPAAPLSPEVTCLV